MVDVLIHVNGDVESVSAVAGTLSHDIEVEDNLCAVLKYKNGSFGTIEVSTSCAPGFPRRMEFSGVDGTVTFEEDKILRWEFRNPLEGDAQIVADSLKKESHHGGRTPLGISIDGHKAQLEDFACAIREGRKPSIDGKEARRAIELICAIYESAKSGKTVYL
jgi:predicted dehydrogenase